MILYIQPVIYQDFSFVDRQVYKHICTEIPDIVSFELAKTKKQTKEARDILKDIQH